MDRKEFYEHVRNDFFTERTASIETFKTMLRSAAPVFGKLEIEITNTDDGGKKIVFIDKDEADVVIGPEDAELDGVNTDMSTLVTTLHLDKNNTITVVEHGFGIFTPANKEQVLLFASFIGKKISFGESE